MGAGQPYLASYLDAYLLDLFSSDSALLGYAPGGPWAERPPSGGIRPVIRWWQRTGGHDTIRQDGQAGRAQSNPEYVVCISDLQTAEQVDRVYGTAGSRQNPEQPYIELASAELYTLLHGRLRSFTNSAGNSYSYYSTILREFFAVQEETSVGGYEVSVGWVVQFRVS